MSYRDAIRVQLDDVGGYDGRTTAILLGHNADAELSRLRSDCERKSKAIFRAKQFLEYHCPGNVEAQERIEELGDELKGPHAT